MMIIGENVSYSFPCNTFSDERPVSVEDTLLLCPAPIINEAGK